MFELVVEKNSLSRSAGGLVHASIYFVVDERCFPQEGWDDFAVVILGWWNEAATRMARGFSRREELDFMDGPYSVQLELDQDGVITVRCLKRGAGDFEEIVGRVAPEVFIEVLLRAGRAIVEACGANGWTGGDLETLSDRIEILESASG